MFEDSEQLVPTIPIVSSFKNSVSKEVKDGNEKKTNDMNESLQDQLLNVMWFLFWFVFAVCFKQN